MTTNILKFHVIFILLISLSSCNKNLIVEPAGSAEYIINNQTNGELDVNFITSEQLGFEVIDSITSIESGSFKVIFMDGIIGVNPKPSDSFSELEFILNNNIDSIYKIETIDNDFWNVIDFDIGSSGYGLKKYELIVNEEDFE